MKRDQSTKYAKDSPDKKARTEYAKAKRKANKAVTLAQQKLAEQLHIKQGKKNVFRIAKQMINKRLLEGIA